MARQNVVNAENLVVDDALHEVERAPTHQHRSGKSLAGPTLRLLMRGTEQQNDARNRENPDGEVKETVLSVLDLHVFDRCGLTSGRRADHVMPAENLVEDNAVEEAAKAEAEDNARTE